METPNLKREVVIAIADADDNSVTLLVNNDYRDSFLAHLRNLKVSCTEPEDCVCRPIRAYIDEQGRKQVESETLVYEITATGSEKDAAYWIETWQIPVV